MCHFEKEGRDSETLNIPLAILVGQLVAAQSHPIPTTGKAQIIELCRTCRRAGKAGVDAFSTAAGMTRVEADCSTCESSK